MLVGFQKRLLQDIFSIFPVLCDILRQPEDLTLIMLRKLIECLSIALTRERHERGFVEYRCFWGQIRFYQTSASLDVGSIRRIQDIGGNFYRGHAQRPS